MKRLVLITIFLCWAGACFAQTQSNYPTSSGGAGTVSNCTSAGNSFYNASGTTVQCDTTIVDSNGTLNFTQASIAASAPWLNHTGTWNNGAAAFTDIFSNITCTAAAIGSKAIDLQVASFSYFQIRYGGANCTLPQMQIPDGTSSSPSFCFLSDCFTAGAYRNGANDWAWTTGANVFFRIKTAMGAEVQAASSYTFSSTAQANGTIDTCVSRQGAGVVRFDANAACSDGLGKPQAQLYTTTTNCAATGTAANPSVASCTAASAGTVACSVSASTGTCTVNTTAVTANSEILITQRTDTTTGTRLSVTCNTTVDTVQRVVTAVTAATSFTFNLGTITSNPECFSYTIVN